MQDSVSNAPLIADRFNEASSFDSVPHETSVILVRVCGWLGVGNNEFDCDAKWKKQHQKTFLVLLLGNSDICMSYACGPSS